MLAAVFKPRGAKIFSLAASRCDRVTCSGHRQRQGSNPHGPGARGSWDVSERAANQRSVDASPAAQRALKGVERLVIRGSFNYQACDDTTCFSPVSLPVSWTVSLRPLDREQAQPVSGVKK